MVTYKLRSTLPTAQEGAWQLLQESGPSEAILHTHALSHAMLAGTLADALEAMRHADLALLLCPDLPMGALHGLAHDCNLRCQAMALLSPCDESRTWQIPATLPRIPKVPRITRPIERLGCEGLSVMSFREHCGCKHFHFKGLNFSSGGDEFHVTGPQRLQDFPNASCML